MMASIPLDVCENQDPYNGHVLSLQASSEQDLNPAALTFLSVPPP